MFERLKNKIPKNFTVIIHYTNEILWDKKDEVYEDSWERIDEYLSTNLNLYDLCGVAFYPKNTAIKLSFWYKTSLAARGIKLYHHRVFICPPVDLLKLMYNHIPNDIHDFVIQCRDKYDIKKMPYDSATWLMSLVLGARCENHQ